MGCCFCVEKKNVGFLSLGAGLLKAFLLVFCIFCFKAPNCYSFSDSNPLRLLVSILQTRRVLEDPFGI